jgi:hypothetical protein
MIQRGSLHADGNKIKYEEDHDQAGPAAELHRPSHSRRRGSKPNVFFAFWFEAPRSFVP